MDPLIKSQLLYQLSYAPPGLDGLGDRRVRCGAGFSARRRFVHPPPPGKCVGLTIPRQGVLPGIVHPRQAAA